MSNLGLSPKFRRRKGVNLEKCLKNVKIIGFLTFFWTFYINEGEFGSRIYTCKRGASILPRQNWKTFPLISLEK